MQLSGSNQVIYTVCFIVAVATSILIFPEGITGIVIAAVGTAGIFYLLRENEDKVFLQRVFLIGILLRVIFAVAIYYFGVYSYFGGDATSYDAWGSGLLQYLSETQPTNNYRIQMAYSMEGSGWGMVWFVAALYAVVGRSIFATMMLECVIGATTALLIYRIVIEIYNNRQAARTAAYLTAFFPAMIIWSAQALKDGLIVFLLVLMMLCIIRLQKQLTGFYLFVLIGCLFGILSLRFYIFYMAALAVVGSFAIGSSRSLKEAFQRLAAFAVIGGVLMYMGAVRSAGSDLEQYGNLEAVQRSREDLSRAESGFGKDLNVSTTEGAMVALPIGFTYLMLAPFPWETRNLRQALAVPESIVWWALLPFFFLGLWYTMKNRWRNAVPILIFTVLLTFAYSLFQGNVGTAYRQRTQIQVFMFIFIAVGLTIQREKNEHKRILLKEVSRRR